MRCSVLRGEIVEIGNTSLVMILFETSAGKSARESRKKRKGEGRRSEKYKDRVGLEEP